MQKIGDLNHNANVVAAVDLKHDDRVATVTNQGYTFIWDISMLSETSQNKALKIFKFDSERIINASPLMDYDYTLYPFIMG